MFKKFKKNGKLSDEEKRKKEVELSNEEIDAKVNYKFVMKWANIWMEKYKENDQRIELLDYLISTLIEDLCTSGVVYPLVHDYASPFTMFFPLLCYDENGDECHVSTNRQIEIDLANTNVYVCPWDTKRIPANLFNLLSNPFEYHKDNQRSDFYTDINLCHVYNGNHSINIGRYLKKGKICSVICNTELLYPHCTTDGVHWYNAHTGQELDRVADFRIAAIYSLAQKRYKYKNG